MRTSSETPYLNGQNERLNRFIGYSLAFHAVCFIAFAVRAYFAPQNQIQFENVIHVDMVGLPDKARPATEAPAPAPPVPQEKAQTPPARPELPKAAKPEPKSESPKVNLNNAKPNAAAALKRLEALERLKSSMNTEKSAQKAETAAAHAPLVKGNEISHGSALKGIAKLNYENYQETAHAHIKKHWNLPHWMANANLNARVRVWIDAQGNIVRKEITSRSARADFDERALRALESATPLPRPPSELANVLAVEGMEIEFVPE